MPRDPKSALARQQRTTQHIKALLAALGNESASTAAMTELETDCELRRIQKADLIEIATQVVGPTLPETTIYELRERIRRRLVVTLDAEAKHTAILAQHKSTTTR